MLSPKGFTVMYKLDGKFFEGTEELKDNDDPVTLRHTGYYD